MTREDMENLLFLVDMDTTDRDQALDMFTHAELDILLKAAYELQTRLESDIFMSRIDSGIDPFKDANAILRRIKNQ